MSISAQAVTFTSTNADLSKVLSTSQWTIDPQALKSHDILLEAVSSPVNPSDIVQLKGTYASKPAHYTESDNSSSEQRYIAGNEGLFKIIGLGSAITNYLVGDWVIPKLPSFGTWRTHAVASAAEDPQPFIKIVGLPLNEAATIRVNPSTAYQIIHQFIKDWSPDGSDWIVQNAGNSQVSKYVTQLAVHFGIKTLSVVRDGKSDADIKELYELGATKVVSESVFFSDTFFKSELPDLVGAGRVRLALNSVGGESVQYLVRALSQDGALASYGASGSPVLSYSGGEQLYKNITTYAYWLTANTKKNPQSQVDTVNSVQDLIRAGKVKSAPVTTIKLADDIATTFLQAIEATPKGKQLVVY